MRQHASPAEPANARAALTPTRPCPHCTAGIIRKPPRGRWPERCPSCRLRHDAARKRVVRAASDFEEARAAGYVGPDAFAPPGRVHHLTFRFTNGEHARKRRAELASYLREVGDPGEREAMAVAA